MTQVRIFARSFEAQHWTEWPRLRCCGFGAAQEIQFPSATSMPVRSTLTYRSVPGRDADGYQPMNTIEAVYTTLYPTLALAFIVVSLGGFLIHLWSTGFFGALLGRYDEGRQTTKIDRYSLIATFIGLGGFVLVVFVGMYFDERQKEPESEARRETVKSICNSFTPIIESVRPYLVQEQRTTSSVTLEEPYVVHVEGQESERLHPTASGCVVIAHPASVGCCRGSVAANTNWRTASTEARLAFAVLTTERKAA